MGQGGEHGWRVLVGGRLGRRPRLGREVARVSSIDEAVALVRGVVDLWVREGRTDERVGHLLDRLSSGGDDDPPVADGRAALTDTEGAT